MANKSGSKKMISSEPDLVRSSGNLKIWLLAFLLIILSGFLYRIVTRRFNLIIHSPINLPVPLANFPKEIGNWAGTDLPIRATTQEYMKQHFADDYLSRRYINSKTNTWADVYVVYCSTKPGGILGHRPQICYPGNGWIADDVEPSSFTAASGKEIPCLVQRFHMPEPQYRESIVLNYYILNGQVTTRENDFSGLLGRRPNIAGDPARYVAQIQISSAFENSAREIAKLIADQVFDVFPDKNGVFKSAGFSGIQSDASK
jgi:EpsI family protein